MKKSLLILLIILSLFAFGCKKEKRLKYNKIEAEHVIEDQYMSSFVLLKTIPHEGNMKDLRHSITVFCDFLKGSGRYYHYYQVDYTSNDDEIDQYYHVFNNQDGDERKYSQNFLPYYKFSGVKNIDVLFEYEFSLDNINVVTQEVKYHEDVITLDEDLDEFKTEINDFEFIVNEVVKEEEDYNLYNIFFNIGDLKGGHIDLQTWIETSDNQLFPFVGIYHYQLDRGNYETYGYERIDKKVNVNKVYFKVNYYKDNNVTTYLYQKSIK